MTTLVALHLGAMPTQTADQAAMQVALGGASEQAGLQSLMRKGRFGLDALVRLSQKVEGEQLQRVYQAIGAFKQEKALVALKEGILASDRLGLLGAVQGLGRLGSPDAAEPLLQAALSRDPEVRAAVVQSLVKVGRPAVAPAQPLLNASSAFGREVALRFLARQSSSSKRAELITRGLRDDAPNVRAAAAEMTELWKDVSLTEALVNLTRDQDSEVASRAVEALAKFPTMRIKLPELLSDDRVTEQAWVTAFHRMRDYDSMAIPYLLAAITKASPERKSKMLGLLSEGASDTELQAFVELLDTQDEDIGKTVEGLLSQMGARADTAAARMVLNERESLAEAIRTYLKTRPRNGITDEIIRSTQEGPMERRQFHLQIIGELDAANEVREELVALLEDTESQIRVSALKTLGGVQDLGTESELVRLLDDVNTEVRVEALRGLKEYDSEISVLARMSAIDDEDSEVRGEALKSFKGADPSAVLRALERVVRNGSHDERVDALSAISEIKTDQAVLLLMDLVTEQDPEVFKAAVGYFDTLPRLDPIYEHAGEGMNKY